MCGAEFPLKVAALDSGGTIGFADEMRPPGGIPNGRQPRWPISPSSQPAPPAQYPASADQATYPAPSPTYGSRYPAAASQGSPGQESPGQGYPGQDYSGQRSQGPVSLSAPGVRVPEEDEIELPPEGAPDTAPPQQRYSQPTYSRPAEAPLPRLGPATGSPVASVGPVAVKPAATLACPIVSMLDKWMLDAVQPAAMRWFGTPVVEIKQISAYSCRGMNGNSNAHISEHAFGNALDVAAFTLADGRRISVKDGWRGLAEEQGFLRDVQGGACQLFNTVLAPGSNVYHYDHIHVDLMRRASGRVICKPAAVSGEQIAGRVAPRNAYAAEPGVTGSIANRLRRVFSNKPLSKEDEATIEDESRIKDSGR